jgi:hypothetical protein
MKKRSTSEFVVCEKQVLIIDVWEECQIRAGGKPHGGAADKDVLTLA